MIQSIHPLRAAALRIHSRPSIHEIKASVLHPHPNCGRRISTSKLPSRSNRFQRREQQIAASTSKTIPSISSQTSPHHFHTSALLSRRQYAPHPQTSDRGPASTESTQTDFSSLDVLGSSQAPSTAVNVCVPDGFHLSSGVKITDGAGALLVGGEAFAWRPWEAADGQNVNKLTNGKGQWEVKDEAWGLLGVVWPKPDLLIIGVGPSMLPLSPATRRFINGLGIRVEVADTRNASAQFNLLATERGVGSVAAALVPIGWKEGVGIVVEDEDA